jgi:hypothetical protein
VLLAVLLAALALSSVSAQAVVRSDARSSSLITSHHIAHHTSYLTTLDTNFFSPHFKTPSTPPATTAEATPLATTPLATTPLATTAETTPPATTLPITDESTPLATTVRPLATTTPQETPAQGTPLATTVATTALVEPTTRRVACASPVVCDPLQQPIDACLPTSCPEAPSDAVCSFDECNSCKPIFVLPGGASVVCASQRNFTTLQLGSKTEVAIEGADSLVSFKMLVPPSTENWSITIRLIGSAKAELLVRRDNFPTRRSATWRSYGDLTQGLNGDIAGDRAPSKTFNWQQAIGGLALEFPVGGVWHFVVDGETAGSIELVTKVEPLTGSSASRVAASSLMVATTVAFLLL